MSFDFRAHFRDGWQSVAFDGRDWPWIDGTHRFGSAHVFTDAELREQVGWIRDKRTEVTGLLRRRPTPRELARWIRLGDVPWDREARTQIEGVREYLAGNGEAEFGEVDAVWLRRWDEHLSKDRARCARALDREPTEAEFRRWRVLGGMSQDQLRAALVYPLTGLDRAWVHRGP